MEWDRLLGFVFFPPSRISSPETSSQILQEVGQKIQSYPFNYRGATILSGQEEGAYGWVTVNYLLENFIKVPPSAWDIKQRVRRSFIKNSLICGIMFTAAETRGVVSDELLARKFYIQSFLVSSSRTAGPFAAKGSQQAVIR